MPTCSQTDLIEIACMEKLELKLILRSGESVQGKAIDLTARNRCEFLKLEMDEGQQKELELHWVEKIIAVSENRHFQYINLI